MRLVTSTPYSLLLKYLKWLRHFRYLNIDSTKRVRSSGKKWSEIDFKSLFR